MMVTHHSSRARSVAAGLAALANAIFYQALVGLIVAMAFTRHRATLPLGIAHGLTIA